LNDGGARVTRHIGVVENDPRRVGRKQALELRQQIT
jgi:hypothetical protein